MQSAFRKRTLACAVAMCSFQPLANSAELEEVIVTAQKHAQSVNDVGITVNAFTGEQIKDLGVFSAEDIAAYTPGLTVAATAATGVPSYTLRGVGFQDYSAAASSTVGLYFDEVAIPYTVMSRGVLFDVARVEVLKGPQGDLYGRNTTAGQINFVSNKPSEEFSASITAGVANFGVFELEGFVNGSLTDAVNARVSLKTTQSSEGWQKSLTRDDELGEKDTTALRGLFDIVLSDQAQLLLNIHYVNDQSDNKANTAYDGQLIGLGSFSNPYTPLDQYIIPGGAYFGETPPWYNTTDNRAADWSNNYTSPITGRSFDIRPQRDNELLGMSAKLEWQLGDMTLTSISAYDGFERTEANDWDGGAFIDSSNINATELDVFSQELRLSGQTDNLLWITGLYYSHDEVDEYYHYFLNDSVFGTGSIPFGVGLFAATPIRELDTKYEQETDSRAIFGHIEWSITDKTRLTVGLRYTEEEREWSGCTFVADDNSLAGFLGAQFGVNLQAGDCGTIDDDPTSPNYIFGLLGTPNINDAFHVYTDTIKTEKWMGKFGIDHEISDDILVYATVANGFKSGGFNGANSNTTQQLQPYGEEELTSYELGVKATLLDNSMQINMAAFMYDYKDKQEQDVAVTFVGNIGGLTNVPESRINGAEIDLQWAASEGLTLSMGAAYLDTLVEEWMAVDPAASAWPITVRRDVSGLELAQAPEWQFNGQVQYEFNISQELTLMLAADFSHQGETSGGAEPENATDDYTLYNARIGLGDNDGQWRVLLWGRNLGNEYYFPAAYTGGNGPYVRSAGMPRTYGLNFTYNF